PARRAEAVVRPASADPRGAPRFPPHSFTFTARSILIRARAVTRQLNAPPESSKHATSQRSAFLFDVSPGTRRSSTGTPGTHPPARRGRRALSPGNEAGGTLASASPARMFFERGEAERS